MCVLIETLPMWFHIVISSLPVVASAPVEGWNDSDVTGKMLLMLPVADRWQRKGNDLSASAPKYLMCARPSMEPVA